MSNLIANLVYLAIVAWVLVFIYHVGREGGPICLTQEAVTKTNDTFVDLFNKVKTKSTLTSSPVDHWEQGPPSREVNPGSIPKGQEIEMPVEEDEEEDTTVQDAIVELGIGKDAQKRHLEYAQEFEKEFGARNVAFQVEREPVDIINWVGLRRPNYSAVMPDDSARDRLPGVTSEQLPKENKLYQFF